MPDKLFRGDITNGVVELNLLDGDAGSLSYGIGGTNNGEIKVVHKGDIPNYTFSSSPYFNDNTLKGLVIGTSCTSIGSYAFNYCGAFTGSLAIPDSVTSIGDGVFIGAASFNGLLILGNGLTSIGSQVFNGTNFTAAYINCPASSWVGSNALFGTFNLTNIYVHADYVSGYTNNWQGSTATLNTWTNYPTPAP